MDQNAGFNENVLFFVYNLPVFFFAFIQSCLQKKDAFFLQKLIHTMASQLPLASNSPLNLTVSTLIESLETL